MLPYYKYTTTDIKETNYRNYTKNIICGLLSIIVAYYAIKYEVIPEETISPLSLWERGSKEGWGYGEEGGTPIEIIEKLKNNYYQKDKIILLIYIIILLLFVLMGILYILE
jgi:hypothetical protein